MKRNKGFTLIELLVVIAVIIILATLIISAISNARNQAKQKAILAEIRGVYQEGELYITNNDGYAPGLKTISSCPTTVDPEWGFLGTEKGLMFIEAIRNKADASASTDAVCAISPQSWAVSVAVYNEGVLLSSRILPLVEEAYALEDIAGYICFDNNRHVFTSSNAIYLDSNGDARQDPASPGIVEVSDGVFECEY